MLVGRLVQGLGGGAMLALSYVGVSLLFPERLWTRVLAIVSGVWGVSSLVGPLVGGVFASAGLWRGAFWAFAAQALLLVVLTPLLVAAHGRRRLAAARFPGRQIAALTRRRARHLVAGVQADVRAHGRAHGRRPRASSRSCCRLERGGAPSASFRRRRSASASPGAPAT